MVRHYYVRLDLDTVRPSHAINLLEAGAQTSCPFQYKDLLLYDHTSVILMVSIHVHMYA